MLKTSKKWTELWRNPLHTEETKLNISGVEYLPDKIVMDSLSITGGLFSTLDIGNCSSRQLDVEIYPQGTIPKQAEIKVFKRLLLGEDASEWLPQGVFFISTRETNKISETLKIHAFDAMLKAGAVWLTNDYVYTNWPMTDREAAEDIAGRMGCELDERCNFTNSFKIDYPVDENGDLTMTDILEGIGVANNGNWVITEEGKLRLIRLGEEPPETNYLVTEDGDVITFGGVRILV